MYTQLCRNLWITRLLVNWIKTSSTSGANSSLNLMGFEQLSTGLSTELEVDPGVLVAAVLAANSVGDFRNVVINVPTFLHPLGNLAVGIHHGGVVTVTEELTDLWQ